MARKPLDTLTESMFYVLMALRRSDLCGTDIAADVEKRTGGRVRLGRGGCLGGVSGSRLSRRCWCFRLRPSRAKVAAFAAIAILLGPKIVPSVAHIRARFDKRRQGISLLDVLLRRLLGLEAKMAQYRDGAAFVRAVHERVGVDGFNAVWTGPETLPLPEEITDPGRWIARVHG